MIKKSAAMIASIGLAGLLVAGLVTLLFTFQVNAQSHITDSSPLTIGRTAQILTLDPADFQGWSSNEILYNTGSGLLNYSPGTTELIPGLATGMPEVSQDGLVYTFTLREGLAFPDGTPFDASAVKWSIDRVANLAGGASFWVTGYVSQTNVVESNMVQFVLKNPAAFFPNLVAIPAYYPVSPNCFPEGSIDPESTCGGIGPYIIQNYYPGVLIELSMNPDFYGHLPQIPDILILQYNNPTDLRQALENGDIDIAWNSLTAQDYQELRADPDLTVIDQTGNFIRYLCMNNTTPPFDNTNIRVALAVAMDREAIAQTVFTDTRTALYSMVPDVVWSHRDSFRDAYGQRNLELARTLLSAEGYSETNKLQMDLWYGLDHYGPLEPAFAAALKSNIEETGMVSVTLQYTDWATYISYMQSGLLPVFMLGWWGDYLDPDNYTMPFAYSAYSSGMGIFYNNPEMDLLLETGLVTTPVHGSEREQIYLEVQNLWKDDVPIVPLLQEVLSVATQDSVHGIKVNPFGMLSYFTIRWNNLYLPFMLRN